MGSHRQSRVLQMYCLDGRIRSLVNGEGQQDDHQMVLPGIVRRLANDGPEQEYLIGLVQAVIALKRVRRIRLYTHDDCGDYLLAFNEEQVSRKALEGDLEKAVAALRHAFPELVVEAYLVMYDEEGWFLSPDLAAA